MTVTVPEGVIGRALVALRVHRMMMLLVSQGAGSADAAGATAPTTAAATHSTAVARIRTRTEAPPSLDCSAFWVAGSENGLVPRRPNRAAGYRRPARCRTVETAEGENDLVREPQPVTAKRSVFTSNTNEPPGQAH